MNDETSFLTTQQRKVLMNRFLFAAWNIWFTFGAARLVLSRLGVRRKLRRLRWQRVSSDV